MKLKSPLGKVDVSSKENLPKQKLSLVNYKTLADYRLPKQHPCNPRKNLTYTEATTPDTTSTIRPSKFLNQNQNKFNIAIANNNENKFNINKKNTNVMGQAYLSLSRRNTMRYLSHVSNKSADLNLQGPPPREAPAAITDYQFSKLLGKGSYAQVRLATHRKSKALFAVKTYEKTKLSDPLKRNSVDREIKILKALNHCGIIGYIDCFNDRL